MSGDGFAVLLCDLDHVQAINDDFGHGTGDQMLQRVAETIKASARSADAVFRYGGEEFLVFTSYRKTSELIEYTERLRRNIGAGHYLGGYIAVSSQAGRKEPGGAQNGWGLG